MAPPLLTAVARRVRLHRLARAPSWSRQQPVAWRVWVMGNLRFPRRLVHAERVMLVLFAGRLLPFSAHALPGPNRVVGGACLRPLDGHALATLTSRTQNMSARRADLRHAVFCENALRELRARLVFAPRPELDPTEPIDPDAATTDMKRISISRKAVACCRSPRRTAGSESHLGRLIAPRRGND